MGCSHECTRTQACVGARGERPGPAPAAAAPPPLPPGPAPSLRPPPSLPPSLPQPHRATDRGGAGQGRTMTETTKTHVILLACGSFNPITKGHIQMFGQCPRRRGGRGEGAGGRPGRAPGAAPRGGDGGVLGVRGGSGGAAPLPGAAGRVLSAPGGAEGAAGGDRPGLPNLFSIAGSCPRCLGLCPPGGRVPRSALTSSRSRPRSPRGRSWRCLSAATRPRV